MQLKKTAQTALFGVMSAFGQANAHHSPEQETDINPKIDGNETAQLVNDQWRENNPEGHAKALQEETEYYLAVKNAQRLRDGQQLFSKDETRQQLADLPNNPKLIRKDAHEVFTGLGSNAEAIQDDLLKISANAGLAKGLIDMAPHTDDPGSTLYKAGVLQREAVSLMEKLKVNGESMVDAGLLKPSHQNLTGASLDKAERHESLTQEKSNENVRER